MQRLIDALSDEKLMIARRYLDALLADHSEPLLQALWFAPIDDEPYIPEERAEDEEARQAYLRGEARDWDEVKAELMGSNEQ